MSVTKAQLLSTGAALLHAEKKHGVSAADVVRVKIDGEDVVAKDARAQADALTHAIAAAEAAAAQHAKLQPPPGADAAGALHSTQSTAPSVWARAWNSVAGTVTESATMVGTWTRNHVMNPAGDFLEENLPTAVTDGAAKATTAAMTVANAAPENVQMKATVSIETRDGRTLNIPVLVKDTEATAVLRTISAIASSVGAVPVPFLGTVVQGGTGLISALASGASYLTGNRERGDALWGMAKKHVALGAVGAVPVVGLVTAKVAFDDVGRLNDLNGIRLEELVLGDGDLV